MIKELTLNLTMKRGGNVVNRHNNNNVKVEEKTCSGHCGEDVVDDVTTEHKHAVCAVCPVALKSK